MPQAAFIWLGVVHFSQTIVLLQATFSFIDNTAELNGAAIYATDIERCTYTPSLNTVDTNTVTERSIFSLDTLFYFR